MDVLMTVFQILDNTVLIRHRSEYSNTFEFRLQSLPSRSTLKQEISP